ncbi:unnamed protein product, partial [Owenia fusiformis]
KNKKMDLEKYDSALLGILQNEGKIEKFLDVVFGFLYRRTDYYLPIQEGKLGFPPGVALQLAAATFKKYEQLAAKDAELKKQATGKVVSPDSNKTKASENKQTKPNENSSQTYKTPKPKDPVTHNQAVVDIKDNAGANKSAEPTPVTSAPKETQTKASGNANDIAAAANKPDGDQKTQAEGHESEDDPELTRKQTVYQENPESYNGAIRDKYSWAQSITDVDVYVKVPATIKKGRDVKVEIKRKSLKFELKTATGTPEMIIDGALTWDVNVEESMWTLEPGKHVHINLEKVQDRWWEALLEGEEKISVRKIDASRPMTDLDDEAQAKIEEMMFNERQKKLGLPQSHEQKNQDILRKAWDAEGSPFKGQPFDPSVLNVQNSAEFMNNINQKS